jgi:hypothetical protein
MEPRHPNPVADAELCRVSSDLFHHAHDLVTGHDRQVAGDLTLNGMQIGVAHAACMNAKQHFVIAGRRNRKINYFERRVLDETRLAK